MERSLLFATYEDRSTGHSLRGMRLSPSFESLVKGGMRFFQSFAQYAGLFEERSLGGMGRQLLCGSREERGMRHSLPFRWLAGGGMLRKHP